MFDTDSRVLKPKATGLHLVGVRGENCPGGSKFDTDSWVLKQNATGLHLVGVRGHTLSSTLALPASWAEVGGSNGGPSNFEFYTI